MPLFEYRCDDCATECELLVRSSTVPVCPSCGSTSLQKQLSMFAVSSEGTTLRSRQKLGAQQRQTSQAVQKEKDHYRHDHHDD